MAESKTSKKITKLVRKTDKFIQDGVKLAKEVKEVLGELKEDEDKKGE